jgi:hypothetical protein
VSARDTLTRRVDTIKIMVFRCGFSIARHQSAIHIAELLTHFTNACPHSQQQRAGSSYYIYNFFKNLTGGSAQEMFHVKDKSSPVIQQESA